ncbi:LOW QUALITY PROTEIN: XK-related protein 8-like [Lates calcarifer]|uniref:XK-related protein n=1 Tax=Lates calcarifer TaxID=8187 RepID=A0AAJ8B1G2_LATCA|nr:LOW QUALITY PROTEIN: XK-related protein 8-like [Lates calcarifer]
MAVFKYNRVDFFFTCLGLIFLLLDIGLDIFAAVSFYQEKEYVSLGFLLLFLLGSSVLVQTYSWLWYSYENFKRDTKVESCLSKGQLRLLHYLQLGIYFRHAGVLEVSLRSFFAEAPNPEGFAVYLSHDLAMLRIIETFSESTPQLVLMLTIMLQWGELDPVTVLKAIGSASAVAFSVTTYHRSLRSFLTEKQKQPVTSSLVYFSWNLFIIMSRLSALALFASVLPCFIFAHFVCSWLVLFFCVWRSKTDFMDTPCGEWLFRATVALIWYFAWFNVTEGKTRNRTLLYHGYKLADISLLCGLWCWKMSTEELYFQIPQREAIIVAVSVVALYIFGLFLKVIYYKFYHPNLYKEPAPAGDEVDFPMSKDLEKGDRMFQIVASDFGPVPSPPPAPSIRQNKRMRKLAENFYS